MITAGVIILLFVGYELYYTGVYTGHEQAALRDRLQQSWQAPTAPAANPASTEPLPVRVDLGSGVAILRVPRLGADWAKVVVEGVDVEDLKKGPGHYPGTAMPGEIGNFVVSGHRTTYGAPFNQLGEVPYPVPGGATATPTQAVLTFTTCNPKYSASQRLVLHGLLESTQPKSAGPPPALRG